MKVAIVGAEARTRDLAPYDDPNYKIWVFNEWANAPWCRRWDALLQLHKPHVYRNINNSNDPQHWEWLQKKHGKPIIMQAVDPLVPDSVAYPLAQINREFMSSLTYEGMEQKYFRATNAYALALALYAGAESIDIWGIELANAAEYMSQQPNFAFWVGLATGRKVPVNLHCCKGMFDKPLYGYEEFMQEDVIQRYIEGLNQQAEELRVQLLKVEGALMILTQMLTEQKNEQDKPAQG